MGQEAKVERIRLDFPILSRLINGRPLAYLDNAATTQKPRQVLEAYLSFYERKNANVHRAIHRLAEEATEAYEEARRKVADFLGARSPREIVFVRGATEAINLVAYSWARRNVGRGDNIVLTVMEHHSNIVPWQLVAQEVGAQLRYVDIDEEGELREDQLEESIDGATKLVAITQASNVLGTIPNLGKAVRLAHEHGARVLVDGAQAAPHLPVSVKELDCDFYAVSGHKMLAPMGIGVLWARRELLEEMPPFHGGGEMIKEVYLDRATWNEVPWKFEAGTPNVAGAVALGTAVDYLRGLDMAWVRRHDIALTRLALELLGELDFVTVYGPREAERRVGLVAFNVSGVHPHDVAALLDREGIAIRSGHHCTMPLHTKLGIEASCRASFYVYNQEEEVHRLAAALRAVREVLG